MANDRDIELLLITGAGASVSFGASGAGIPAMPEWCTNLSGALGARDPGLALLVHLHNQMTGPEFERQLGLFFASARAFRDARDLMVDTNHFAPYLPEPLNRLMTRPNIEQWHDQMTAKIDQVFEVVHETLYKLFGRPSVDGPRAQAAYASLLETIGIGAGGDKWVYATTNYDTIGDEALEALRFRVETGERHPVRAGEATVDPERLLDRVRGGVPLLHLHGRIGWYRRSAREGGQAIAVSNDTYQPGFGTPIVMLPDPNKVYDSYPVINTIWTQFGDALSRARRVLVLGHSLNDDQIVDAIAAQADPESVAVTAYAHPNDGQRLNAEDDPVPSIARYRLPHATVIPIRFGEQAESPQLKAWAYRFR